MDVIAREVNIAVVAELISEPSRAAMLDALLDKRMLSAGELAYRARISPQTASTHLAKLVEGGLLVSTTQGRHRYYGLANAEVAHALEALAVIAPPARIRSLRESLAAEQLRVARTCYDHLAGKLGVGLTEALQHAGVLSMAEQDRSCDLTEAGIGFLSRLDIDVEKLRASRRSFAHLCLDWSERRYHLAGALGAALTERFLQLQWLEKLPSSRAVRLMESGEEGFKHLFGKHCWL